MRAEVQRKQFQDVGIRPTLVNHTFVSLIFPLFFLVSFQDFPFKRLKNAFLMYFYLDIVVILIYQQIRIAVMRPNWYVKTYRHQ